MYWTGFAVALSVFSTWELVKCTLFASEFERERVDYLLMKFGVSRDKLEAAKQTVFEYRLRVIPLWLAACSLSWLFLIATLKA